MDVFRQSYFVLIKQAWSKVLFCVQLQSEGAQQVQLAREQDQAKIMHLAFPRFMPSRISEVCD